MGNKRPPEMAIDPHKLGRSFIKNKASDKQGRRTLRFHRGEWLRWEGGRYRVVSPGELKAELTRFIKYEIDTKQLVNQWGKAYTVTSGLVTNVTQAVAGELLVADSVDVPIMLGGNPAGQFLAFKNGLVGLEGVLEEKPELKPHTPEWFSPVVFPYEFDVGASSPRWVEFLTHVLEKDLERLNFVQDRRASRCSNTSRASIPHLASLRSETLHQPGRVPAGSRAAMGGGRLSVRPAARPAAVAAACTSPCEPAACGPSVSVTKPAR